MKGITYWYTGLPCSGKTTLINAIHEKVGGCIMDGDAIRATISKGVGFSPEDRKIHLLRMAHICKLMNDQGVNVLAGFVSPNKEVREEIRSIIGLNNFKLIYVDASIQKCINRDVKGMYAKAIKGEIKDFTGIQAPYQPPSVDEYDLRIGTEVHTLTKCVELLLNAFYRTPKKEFDLFIGRYQVSEPHAGHTGIISTVLKEGKNVCIGLRDRTYSDKDPFTLYERRKAFEKIYKKEIEEGRVVIQDLVDIVSVDYGRTPAWQIREVIMPESIQEISATAIRKKSNG
jgi:adenylylsulfate kinase